MKLSMVSSDCCRRVKGLYGGADSQLTYLHPFEKSHLRPWAAVQDATVVLVDEITSNNFSPAAFKWCFRVVY